MTFIIRLSIHSGFNPCNRCLPILNISRSLSWATQRYGEREALVFEQRRWTYAALNRDVHALAAGLRRQGIGPGDRLATIAMNSAEYLILALALARLGAVLVPLNYRLQQHELIELIRRSGAVALASEEGFEAIAIAAVHDIEGLKLQLDFSTSLTPGLSTDFTSIPVLIAQHLGEVVADWACEPDNLLRVMYTSGTTSKPKGVRITHGNCWANMHAHAVEFSITHEDRLLIVAPLYHVGGFDIPGLTLIHVGGTIVLMRRFDAASALATIAKERITGITLVATMMNMILALPDRHKVDTASLRWIIFGQVTRELFERALELFPTAALTEGYGMTETCGGVAYVDRAHLREKLGSVGLAVQGMEIIVADADDQPLPAGETGEILLRGPKVCAGYIDDPEANTAALRNGWLHTGDVGRFDDEGYLYVQDRIKDMIRSGGENMSASEIERVVEASDDIAEAAVISIPDPHWVEVPAVFVVSRSAQAIDCDALTEHCRVHLPGFKVPKAIFQIDVLPRNVGSKVLKAELRELATKLKPVWTATSG